jgi:hypothetical protein
LVTERFRWVPIAPKALSRGRSSGIVPGKTSEEVKVLVRLVGLAALGAAGLLVAYDMNSGPSYSDGPMPSVRDAVACDGRVYASRQTEAGEQAMWEPTPESALRSGLLAGEQWWIETDAVRVVARNESRVLFVHDVDARARFAAMVDRARDGEAGAWRLSAWAMCDPSELTGDGSDRLGYGVWLDAAGDAVPTSSVMSVRGPEKCGWEDVTFIEVNRNSTRPRQFVHAPGGELADLLRTTYDAHAHLPSVARDTGWRRGGLALWLHRGGDAAYLVNLADPTDVQRWPRSKRTLGCA